MIDEKIYTEFFDIERGYKNNKLQWGNYLSQIDWDMKDGTLNVFIKDSINKASNIIHGDLERLMNHELRDTAIIRVLKYINARSILDIGADTGLFLARCKANSIDGIGIEPNKAAVDWVNKKDFITLFCFDLETLMEKFKNKNKFDVVSMLNTFHGEWVSADLKEDFTKYMAENFKYAVLSDDYKNNKPDPVLTKYFDIVYDFNFLGMAALRDYKNSEKTLRKIFKDFKVNQIYEKMHRLSIHKLYGSKKIDI